MTEGESSEIEPELIWKAFEQEYLLRDEPYSLVTFRSSTSTSGRDEQVVDMMVRGEEASFKGEGNGPVDAFVDGMSRAGAAIRVLDYSEHALSAGNDALAAAYVECEIAGEIVWGVGIHANIVMASLRAVVSAANRADATTIPVGLTGVPTGRSDEIRSTHVPSYPAARGEFPRCDPTHGSRCGRGGFVARIINQVAVFGLGKVGELVALLLADAGFKVVGLDAAPRPVLTAEGVELEVRPLDVNDEAGLLESLRGVDAVVSCLPWHLNIAVAEAAFHAGVHYFDLTEDVATTQRVHELSATRTGSALAPQCGLAPGLIGIVGASLAEGFDEIRSIELKVGALPQNPTGLLGYAFNWSAEGVVNEYLNDCEVLRSGKRQMVPAMTEKERVYIGGIELEAALTSGGLGTMCETYEGRVNRLDYKTLRYPGHFRQMHFLFDELNLRDQRELIGRLLVDAKPPVNDDIVYLHAAVEGVKNAEPFRENYVRAYLPLEIGGRRWRAISWTTAASAVAVVELVADGRISSAGFVKQEEIALADLLDTTAGRLFAETGIAPVKKDLT